MELGDSGYPATVVSRILGHCLQLLVAYLEADGRFVRMVFVLNFAVLVGDFGPQEVENFLGGFLGILGPGTASIKDDVGDLEHCRIIDAALEAFNWFTSVDSMVNSLNSRQISLAQVDRDSTYLAGIPDHVAERFKGSATCRCHVRILARTQETRINVLLSLSWISIA